MFHTPEQCACLCVRTRVTPVCPVQFDSIVLRLFQQRRKQGSQLYFVLEGKDTETSGFRRLTSLKRELLFCDANVK